MSRSIILANGQRIVVVSIGEATVMLDCGVSELGEWIGAGLINSCQCPSCKFTYPVKSDLEDLVQYVNGHPTNVPLDELVHDRLNVQVRQSHGLFGREKPIPTQRRTQPEQARTQQKSGRTLERRNR
jgi:hypothetical protein